MFTATFSDEKKSIYPELALLEDHKWVKPWVIRVSAGLIEVVSDLLTSIEEVMGPVPDLSYLRITEELNDDRYASELSALYQRKLRVFIQAREAIDARDSALNYVTQAAIKMSLSFCFGCGNELQIKNIGDDDERHAYPFLPKLINGDQGSSRAHVCLVCAYEAWKEVQDNTVEMIDYFNNSADIETEEEEDSTDDLIPATTTITEENISEASEEEAKQRQIAVFSITEVDQLAADNADASRDHANRIKGLVKKLRNTSANKDLITIPDEWRDFCDNLALNFPNFSQVVDFIRNQLALSAASDRVLRLPPFLLTGNPGIGKTEFALTIATDLNTRLEVIDMASAQSGMGLSGSESHWSNSQPGALFNALVFNQVANPIIMLDEVDKVRSDKSYNPLAALHQLLEPRQAKRFRDLSVPELNVDASHVIWIATANTIDSIDKPIVDRFTVFPIADPSRTQMSAIVSNQYQRFIDTHPCGKIFQGNKIDPDVLDKLCKHHPRKVRKMLDQAFGLAAIHKRSYLIVDDIKASDTENKRKTGIGFMSDDC